MSSTATPSIHLTPIAAGASLAFYIGQHVRHRDYKGRRVTGIVQGLQVDTESGLLLHCVLDEPLVIPADQHGPEIRIHHQHAPAHEFTPLDERDELIAELVGTLVAARDTLRTVLDETPDADEPKRSALSARIRTLSDTIDKASSETAGAAA